MGTILASAIIDKAQIVMQDTAATRWADAECLGWLNHGQRAACALRPDINSKTVAQATAAGTKQALPSEATSLLDVVRNMGAGSTAGAPIRRASREMMDAVLPTWHTETAAAAFKHYVYDARFPKLFYVYPPSTGTDAQVEVQYTLSPTDVAAVGNAISIDDIYEPVLLDYILYRACQKDAEIPGMADRANTHYQAFANALSAKTNVDGSVVPAPGARP